jgi:UDP-N-acetylglucosamine--N-acetylmuramyl-(pentapeptide) pyrophosphoryl-undecaprenol N-acetylglucosamine transferase
MKILFAGGVTGGHIAPGVALAQRITRDLPDAEIMFASVGNEIEQRMIADAGYDLTKVAERTSSTAATALSLPGAWLRARRLLAKFQPDVVVGLGGSASLGPVIAAKMAHRPLVMLEGNVVPGRAVRWLASRADEVCCQWPEAAETLGSHAHFTGSPVRREIRDAQGMDRARARTLLGLSDDLPVLLVLGGSQGAHAINLVMMESAARLAGHVQIVHLAGEADNPKVSHAYRAAGLQAHVSSFFEMMHVAYAASDLAVSRAGAGSIAELAAAGLPSILVPYPHARDDHQQANALAVARQGWGVIVDQHDLDSGIAADLILKVLTETPQLERMRERARAAAQGDAAQVIIDRLCELTNERAGASTTAAQV